MKARIASLGLMLAVVVACGGAQVRDDKPTAPPTPEQVVSDAKTILEQYKQGYEVLSLAALQPLYIEGLDVIVVRQGKAHRGWTQVENYLKELFTRFDTVRVDVKDVGVVALGDDAAEVIAMISYELKEGSMMIKETGVLTLTLSRIGERWLIRSEHFSYGLR